MIEAVEYRARCDEVGCTETLSGVLREDLQARGEVLGWQFGVRADGTAAIRNGKTYCPDHRRSARDVRGQPPMVRFLVALALSSAREWRPTGGGEWSAARTAHGRGLLDVHRESDRQWYTLTESGWDLARRADERVAAAAAGAAAAAVGGGGGG